MISESKLVKIGKLISHNRKDIIGDICKDNTRLSGEVYFRTLPPFNQLTLSLKDVFLVLDEASIRYIVPNNFQQIGTRIICEISDIDILCALSKVKSAFLAISEDMYKELRGIDNSMIGMSIYYNNDNIGTIVDVFSNNAHDVIVTHTTEGKEIMIPDVGQYVASKDFVANKIVMQNIEDFLHLEL